MQRLGKLVLAGVISFGLLATGSSMLIASVLGGGEPDAVRIDETTGIVIERWCLACGEYRSVKHPCAWQGSNRAELEELLAAELPGARLLSFSKEQVVVLLPPGYCEQCLAYLPQQGYIGLAADNQLAVFSQDGTLFKLYGDAPGAWLTELAEGIPFFDPQDCLDWLTNLTS